MVEFQNHFNSLDGMDFHGGNQSLFSVMHMGLRYECFLQKFDSDKLFVILNGAVNRSNVELPIFSRWNWIGLFKANMLGVFDPTIYMSGDLRLGWYIGSERVDVTAGLVALIERVASLLLIDPRRIILYGSSGGGFAAMATAARFPQGKCISINAQLDIVNSHEEFHKRFERVFSPRLMFKEAAVLYPTRFSAIEAVRDAQTNGRWTRVVIVQNTLDPPPYMHSYKEFSDTFGLPEKGGVNPDSGMMSMLYTLDIAHGREPPDVAVDIMSRGVPFLLSNSS
jgi:hypothetical protein